MQDGFEVGASDAAAPARPCRAVIPRHRPMQLEQTGIDVRLQRADAEPFSVSSTGDPAELFAVVANVGRSLRAHLGLRDTSDDAARIARAAFPQSTEATRLYAEGAARMRVLDTVGARELFERAAERAGLSAKVVRRPLHQISSLTLPAVLLLNNRGACLLNSVAADGACEIVDPDTGGVSKTRLTELERAHSELKDQVRRLERRAYLTPNEQTYMTELKKQKLAAKDQIAMIKRDR